MQYLNETGFKALIKLIKTKLITKSKLNNNSILKYVYGEVQEALPDEDYVKPVHYHTNAQLTNYNWFSYSSIAPSNTNLLWIDPKEGLKYHNGTAWVVVPIGFYESLDTTTTYTLTSGDNIGSVTIDGVAATLPVQINAGTQIIIKSPLIFQFQQLIKLLVQRELRPLKQFHLLCQPIILQLDL